MLADWTRFRASPTQCPNPGPLHPHGVEWSSSASSNDASIPSAKFVAWLWHAQADMAFLSDIISGIVGLAAYVAGLLKKKGRNGWRKPWYNHISNTRLRNPGSLRLSDTSRDQNRNCRILRRSRHTGWPAPSIPRRHIQPWAGRSEGNQSTRQHLRHRGSRARCGSVSQLHSAQICCDRATKIAWTVLGEDPFRGHSIEPTRTRRDQRKLHSTPGTVNVSTPLD